MLRDREAFLRYVTLIAVRFYLLTYLLTYLLQLTMTQLDTTQLETTQSDTTQLNCQGLVVFTVLHTTNEYCRYYNIIVI